MDALIIFLAAACLLALLGLVAVFNFARYRFKGDKTPVLIALFAACFIASVVATVFLFVPDDAATAFSSF